MRVFGTGCSDRRQIQGLPCKMSSSKARMHLKLLILGQSYSLVPLMALSSSPVLRILPRILLHGEVCMVRHEDHAHWLCPSKASPRWTLGTWMDDASNGTSPEHFLVVCMGTWRPGDNLNIPQVSSAFLMWGQSSIGLELGKQARLADQQAPVICLSLPPWC